MVRSLYEGELATVGEFTCPPGDAAWRTVNFIGSEVHLVYPRVPVVIAQLGHAPMLATPNHVMLYDANQLYRRELASPAGDRCYFLRVSPRRVAELLTDLPDERLPAPALPLEAPAYLLAYRLVDRLLGSGERDALEVEEATVALARLSLRSTAPRNSAANPSRRRHRHALAEAAKEYLVATFSYRTTLADVGRALYVSPWHLARLFRQETGFTLHAYRQQLRLRRALELLSEGCELTEIALAVGFSSHSHLTTAFTRAFGRPPSHVRVTELRTIVKAAELLPS